MYSLSFPHRVLKVLISLGSLLPIQPVLFQSTLYTWGLNLNQEHSLVQWHSQGELQTISCISEIIPDPFLECIVVRVVLVLYLILSLDQLILTLPLSQLLFFALLPKTTKG